MSGVPWLISNRDLHATQTGEELPLSAGSEIRAQIVPVAMIFRMVDGGVEPDRHPVPRTAETPSDGRRMLESLLWKRLA